MASTSNSISFNFVPPLSYATKFSFGVGHILNDLCASMWFTYLLIYFHSVLQYNNKLAGVILLIGQIADGISTPFVGFESDKVDNFWLCRYGRRKTWHLIGTICVLASFPFLFMKCVGCENTHHWAQLFYYAAFVIVFQFGWASVQISHLSLIPDMTPDPHERTELNAIRYAFTVMSNVCVYGITWLILGVASDPDSTDSVGPKDLPKFQKIVLIVVSIGAVFSALFHIGVKEQSASYIESLFADKSISGSCRSDRVSMIWKDWFKEFQFYQVAVLYMCTRLFVNLSQVYIPLFLQDTLKLNESSIAIIPLVMFTSGFVSSFFMKILNKKAGRKSTYLMGAAIGVGACIWIFVARDANFRYLQLYFVASLLGIGGSTMLITSLSITNDLIGSNVESGAFVFGAMSLSDKFSNGIAVLVIQYFHPCDTCCVDCGEYYRYILSCVCGGAAIVAMITLFTLAPFSIGDRKLSIPIAPEIDHCGPLPSSMNSNEKAGLLAFNKNVKT